MNVFDYIIGGLLLLMAVFLVVAIMLQSGKGKGLSGTIAGGSSDSYFGKNKGKTRDQVLSRLTTVVAIVFVVLVLLLYIFQGFEVGGDTSSTGTTSSAVTSSPTPGRFTNTTSPSASCAATCCPARRWSATCSTANWSSTQNNNQGACYKLLLQHAPFLCARRKPPPAL